MKLDPIIADKITKTNEIGKRIFEKDLEYKAKFAERLIKENQ